MEAKFGGKIGDRFFDRAALAGLTVCVLPREIMAEGIMHFLELTQKIPVLRDLYQPGLPRKLEHSNGIVVRPIPELGIEMTEEAARRGFPGPPQIEDHLAQRFEGSRERRNHIIGVVSRHGADGALIETKR